MARPTLLDDEMLQRARSYLENCPDELPTKEGLGLHVGIARATIHNWQDDGLKEDPTNPLSREFLDILDGIMQEQARRLISNGLAKKWDGTITKLMLTKHDYMDKHQTDVTTNGESINVGKLDPAVSAEFSEYLKTKTKSGE